MAAILMTFAIIPGTVMPGATLVFYQTLYLLLPTGKKFNTSPRMTNAPPTQSNVLPPRPKINPKIKRIRPNVIIFTFQKTYGQRLTFSSCLPCCLATALRFALSDWTRMLSLIQLFYHTLPAWSSTPSQSRTES